MSVGKVKCNMGGLSSFISYLKSLKSKLDGIFTGDIANAETCNNNAEEALGGEPSKQVQNADGYWINNPVHAAWENRESIISANATAISTAKGKQSDIDDVLDKVIGFLENMEKSIDKFETGSENVEFTIEATKRTVVNEVTGVEVTQLVFSVTDSEGTTRDYTMSELVNSFYTMYGMEMQSVYQAALLRDELGLNPLTDDDIMSVLNTSGSVVNFAYHTGLYGIASLHDMNNYKKHLRDAGFDLSEDVENLLSGVDFEDEETRKKVIKYLLSMTNGATFLGAVSAGVTSIYGLWESEED